MRLLAKLNSIALCLSLAFPIGLRAEDTPDLPVENGTMEPAPTVDSMPPMVDYSDGLSGSAAVPGVTTVSGSFSKGQTVTISGSNFGTKSPAAPLVWADFENGLNPSTLGVQRTWSEVQSMAASSEGTNGSKGLKATDGSGKWTLRVDYNAWTRDNQKFYVFKRQKKNFAVTSASQNWKVWRMWPAGARGYPNIYYATNNSRVFVEGTNVGAWTTAFDNKNGWTAFEIIGKASSASGRADGQLSVRWDGSQVVRADKLLTRSSSMPALMTCNYVVQGVLANSQIWAPGWSSANRLWVDDVYVDTTWSRVMIGEASTFAACKKLEIQIPKTWSTSSISFVANPGSFTNGSKVYVYVFDSNGNVNATGAALNIGQSYSGYRLSSEGNSGSSGNAEKNIFNPARGETCVLHRADQPAHVDATIFDIHGRTVRELSLDVSAGQPALWDGKNNEGEVVASGVYIVARSVAGQREAPFKVVVLK